MRNSGEKVAIGVGLAGGLAAAIYYLTKPAAAAAGATGSGTTAGVPGQLGATGTWVCHKSGDFTVCVQQNGVASGSVQGAPPGPPGTTGTLGWCYRDSGGAIVCIEPIPPPKKHATE